MSYIKKAEQNVLNVCEDLLELMEIFETLQQRSYKYVHQWDVDEFNRHMSSAKKLILQAYYYQISNAFVLCGVGGDECLAYAKKKFIERFNPDKRIEIMSFLDKYGQTPSWYSSADEDAFRDEVKQGLENDRRE